MILYFYTLRYDDECLKLNKPDSSNVCPRLILYIPSEEMMESRCLKIYGLNDHFIDSGTPDDLEKKYGFDSETLAKKFYDYCKDTK